MIRTVLSTLLIAFAFHLCFLSTSHGEDVDCTTLNTSANCCASACMFLNCPEDNSTGCYNLTINMNETCPLTAQTNQTIMTCKGISPSTVAPTTTPTVTTIVTSPSTTNSTNTSTAAPETSTSTPSSSVAPTGPTNTSTAATVTTTASQATQHFDGPSFIGGIVLCAGIMAIVFFGCKFYKARQERNYHTL
ncbi:sialomucin core protein 24-like [Haliotis cracherodii]|uniref:sialomucin core protein 24-like n=1 Tax=Haliotis cracherodii TaxID=6455 RepID=UPI0039EBCACD